MKPQGAKRLLFAYGIREFISFAGEGVNDFQFICKLPVPPKPHHQASLQFRHGSSSLRIREASKSVVLYILGPVRVHVTLDEIEPIHIF